MPHCRQCASGAACRRPCPTWCLARPTVRSGGEEAFPAWSAAGGGGIRRHRVNPSWRTRTPCGDPFRLRCRDWNRLNWKQTSHYCDVMRRDAQSKRFDVAARLSEGMRAHKSRLRDYSWVDNEVCALCSTRRGRSSDTALGLYEHRSASLFFCGPSQGNPLRLTTRRTHHRRCAVATTVPEAQRHPSVAGPPRRKDGIPEPAHARRRSPERRRVTRGQEPSTARLEGARRPSRPGGRVGEAISKVVGQTACSLHRRRDAARRPGPSSGRAASPIPAVPEAMLPCKRTICGPGPGPMSSPTAPERPARRSTAEGTRADT
ncbi:hypothetical protein SUDANB51_06139 [Streptomyces sp. enrichment culture]